MRVMKLLIMKGVMPYEGIWLKKDSAIFSSNVLNLQHERRKAG